tara:strand:- start:1466 stop:1756 length:291 start_codon:yes stop_codon:yes gene_type:complete
MADSTENTAEPTEETPSQNIEVVDRLQAMGATMEGVRYIHPLQVNVEETNRVNMRKLKSQTSESFTNLRAQMNFASVWEKGKRDHNYERNWFVFIC